MPPERTVFCQAFKSASISAISRAAGKAIIGARCFFFFFFLKKRELKLLKQRNVKQITHFGFFFN